jgi:hypothetical protein
MEVSGQTHAPAALAPEKEPLLNMLCGPRSFGEVKNISTLVGVEPRTVQSVIWSVYHQR